MSQGVPYINVTRKREEKEKGRGYKEKGKRMEHPAGR